MAQPTLSSRFKRLLDWRIALSLILLVTPVIVLLVMGWEQRWISDDGLINATIAQNLADGYGPVFNVGERVEAHTSTLWVVVLAVLAALGMSAAETSVYLSIMLSIGGMALALLGACRLHSGRVRRTAISMGMLPLGAIVYAAVPAAWDYASSGLETGLTLFWLGGCFFALAHLYGGPTSNDEEPSSRPEWQFYATAFLLGLGPLVRPDLTLFSFGFLIPLLIAFFAPRRGGFSFKNLVLLGAAMGAIPVGYQLFRMGYYGSLAPNTAYAKEAFESRWQQGWHYYDHFFERYRLLIPLALAFVVWARHASSSVIDRAWGRLSLYILPVICGVGHCVYVIKVGGGFMHGRLLLPGLFGMLLPVAAVPLRIKGASVPTAFSRGVAMALVIGWALYCGLFIRVPVENEHGIGDERGWWARQSGKPNPVNADDYAKTVFHRDATKLRKRALKACPRAFGVGETCKPIIYARPSHRAGIGRLKPNPATYPLASDVADRDVALAAMRVAIGIRSQVLGPHIQLVDKVGLADPIASHLVLKKRRRPGHEKALNDAWMIARFGEPTDGEDPRITAARRAYECGALAELKEAVEGPISLRRFLSNIAVAPRLHELRIPKDPIEAERLFCGS